MEFETGLIQKTFNDCYGLYDSTLKAIYENDKLKQEAIRDTLERRTGLRKTIFIDLPRMIDTYVETLCPKDRKEIRKQWNEQKTEKDWYLFLIKKHIENGK